MSRILLIEDDEAVIGVLRRMLVGAGYDVEAATNGKAGLARYLEQPSDVVLTDIVMPDMEGLDVIRALRRHDPAARIIAMSGGGVGSANSYLQVARKLGAGWMLEKPLTRDEVLAIVAEAMASSPGTSAA